MNAHRRRQLGLVSLALVAIVLCGLALLAWGCSTGFPLNADGTPDYSRPITGVGSWGRSQAEAAGGIVGQIAGALGIPGAGLIGTAATAVVGLLGGGVLHQRGKFKAEQAASVEHDRAWDESEARARGLAAVPPPAPAAAVMGVPS